MPNPTGKYELYEHHGVTVAVDTGLKGGHRLYCLCSHCLEFTPEDRKKNCVIANALYRLCCEHNVVAPIWECPCFKTDSVTAM